MPEQEQKKPDLPFKKNFLDLPTPRPLEYYIGTTNAFAITDLPYALRNSGPIDRGTYVQLTDEDESRIEKYELMWKQVGAPKLYQWAFQRRETPFDGYSYELGNRYDGASSTRYARLILSKLVYVAGNGFAAATSNCQEDLWEVRLAVTKCHHWVPESTQILLDHPYSKMALSTWDLIEWLYENDREILHQLLVA